VSAARPRRFPCLAFLLAVLPGCSWVHSRQALEPNRPGRIADALKGLRRADRDPPPRVILGVEPDPKPAAAPDRSAAAEPKPTPGPERP
jgi:hypothetical protein